MKLPKTIYVRVVDDEPPYLTANVSIADAVDEDGPSTIGVYQLVETVTAEKMVSVTKGKKKRGGNG